MTKMTKNVHFAQINFKEAANLQPISVWKYFTLDFSSWLLNFLVSPTQNLYLSIHNYLKFANAPRRSLSTLSDIPF